MDDGLEREWGDFVERRGIEFQFSKPRERNNSKL